MNVRSTKQRNKRQSVCESIKAGAVKSWCLAVQVSPGVPACAPRSARCDALLRRAQDSCAYKPGDHPPLGNSAHFFFLSFFFFFPGNDAPRTADHHMGPTGRSSPGSATDIGGQLGGSSVKSKISPAGVAREPHAKAPREKKLARERNMSVSLG